jgi:hypothetical protein
MAGFTEGSDSLEKAKNELDILKNRALRVILPKQRFLKRPGTRMCMSMNW